MHHGMSQRRVLVLFISRTPYHITPARILPASGRMGGRAVGNRASSKLLPCFLCSFHDTSGMFGFSLDRFVLGCVVTTVRWSERLLAIRAAGRQGSLRIEDLYVRWLTMITCVYASRNTLLGSDRSGQIQSSSIWLFKPWSFYHWIRFTSAT